MKPPGAILTSTRVFIPGEEPGEEIKVPVYIDPNGGLCVDLDEVKEIDPEVHERLGTDKEDALKAIDGEMPSPRGSRPADEETGTPITS